MRFALTTEQQDLREVVRELLADACPPAVIRAAAEHGPEDPAVAALYRGFADLGAVGLLRPTADGGLGLDENYLVPLLTEVGRAGVPLPIVDTVAVAAGLLGSVGRGDAAADGTVLCVADPAGSGLVRHGRAASLLLSGGWGGTGEITVVDLGDADRHREAAMDPAADVCRISGGREIARVDDPLLVGRAWERGVLGTAAVLIGLARRMIDMTAGYVAERRQFGVPIGSFQAVKHTLASALMAVEFAAPAVARAGAALADEDAAASSVHVSTAKALASDAASQVARAAIQCHGAIAYTTEYDLQLFAKQAWALAASWGSAAWHRERVATELGLSHRAV